MNIGMQLTSLSKYRIFSLASIFILSALLTGCGTLAGPHQVEIPLAKLQAELDRHFSTNNIAPEFLDLRLSHPHLTLLPETDRVAVDLETSVTPPFMQKSFIGKLTVSGRLYIDVNHTAVYMTETHIDRLTLSDFDPAIQQKLESGANNILGNLINKIPVYSFHLEDLRYAGIKFVPTLLTTTHKGILVTVEPAN